MPTKWMWMMKWCKKRGFPPANEYFWGLADKAFSERFCKDKEENMTYDLNYCSCCHKSPCECNIPKLLPCPFCNGTNVGVRDEGLNVYQIGCKDCNIIGPSANSKVKAAKYWNNRPGHDYLLTKIEHLEFEKD